MAKITLYAVFVRIYFFFFCFIEVCGSCGWRVTSPSSRAQKWHAHQSSHYQCRRRCRYFTPSSKSNLKLSQVTFNNITLITSFGQGKGHLIPSNQIFDSFEIWSVVDYLPFPLTIMGYFCCQKPWYHIVAKLLLGCVEEGSA